MNYSTIFLRVELHKTALDQQNKPRTTKFLKMSAVYSVSNVTELMNYRFFVLLVLCIGNVQHAWFWNFRKFWFKRTREIVGMFGLKRKKLLVFKLGVFCF